MLPKENHIKVARTARYYTLGEINKDTRRTWIVLHGHKMLAGNFIKTFSELADAGDYIIAPEALSRLYVKGDYGDVGANWMTKEDRESEISDYVNYLDELYEKEIAPYKKQFAFEVNALGFSQGAATLSRWLVYGHSAPLMTGRAMVDKAIFWCGNLAHDVDYSESEQFKLTTIYLVFADNDQYYPPDFYKTQVELLQKSGIEPQYHVFNGKHEINAGMIKKANLILNF
jgi:predicted esterase